MKEVEQLIGYRRGGGGIGFFLSIQGADPQITPPASYRSKRRVKRPTWGLRSGGQHSFVAGPWNDHKLVFVIVGGGGLGGQVWGQVSKKSPPNLPPSKGLKNGRARLAE